MKKFSNRVLVLDGGYHLYKEILSTLPILNCDVCRLVINKNQSVNEWIANLFKTIESFKPDFILTVNQFGFDVNGEIEDYIEKHKIPVAVWYVDSPLFILKQSNFPAPNMTKVFLWEKTYEKIMRSKGAKDIYYLPLATDPDRFRLEDRPTIDKDVVFVGDSMTKAIDKVKKALSKDQIELGESISKDLVNGKRFDEIFENIEELPQENIWSILELAVWMATARKRLEIVQSLDDYDLHIYGDIYWKKLVPKAIYRGPVNYGKDLSRVFASSSVVLNTTSYQMPTAVNQRVFDVPMSGSFVLTDNQSDMFELFKFEEFVSYRDTDELNDYIEILTTTERRKANKDWREAKINNCQKKILAEHTYVNRLETLLSIMEKS